MNGEFGWTADRPLRGAAPAEAVIRGEVRSRRKERDGSLKSSGRRWSPPSSGLRVRQTCQSIVPAATLRSEGSGERGEEAGMIEAGTLLTPLPQTAQKPQPAKHNADGHAARGSGITRIGAPIKIYGTLCY